MRYYCPIFKMMKLKLREVTEPTLGHRISRKAELEPMSVLFQVYAFTATIFMEVNSVPHCAKW